MCMITYIPRSVDIPTSGIEAGSKSNKDGHGWAVASKRGLVTGKSMDFEEAITGLMAARAQAPGSAALFHSRFGTHGEYGLYNVHPFYTGDNAVMAHNGVLSKGFLPLAGDRRSDTRIFVDTFGRPFSDTESGVPSRRAAKMLGELIGAGNKLLFLAATDNGPAVRIVNAQAGEWDNGVWYSNTYYRAARKYWSGSTPTYRKNESTGQWERETYKPLAVSPSHSTPKAIGTGSTGYPQYPYGNSWATPKPDAYVGYSAKGTYGGEIFSEREFARRDSGAALFRETCKRCGSTRILELAQVCEDCRMCMDCERDLDLCTCFESAKAYLEKFGEN